MSNLDLWEFRRKETCPVIHGNHDAILPCCMLLTPVSGSNIVYFMPNRYVCTNLSNVYRPPVKQHQSGWCAQLPECGGSSWSAVLILPLSACRYTVFSPVNSTSHLGHGVCPLATLPRLRKLTGLPHSIPQTNPWRPVR